MPELRTIIAGCRTADRKHVDDAMEVFTEHFEIGIIEVVSGAARGADIAGERWAEERDIPVKQFKADWDKHGKAAGPIRNAQMADYADCLVAVWDGQSKGTRSMIEYAVQRGLLVYVLRIGKGG